MVTFCLSGKFPAILLTLIHSSLLLDGASLHFKKQEPAPESV